jgi:uncharacterized protein
MNLSFPYSFDSSGRTATGDLQAHVREMVELLLFTSPGERVNRPNFGTGTAQLVFAPNSDVLASSQQQMVQAGLQQWLSDLIRVRSVEVESVDAVLRVTVQYVLVQGGQPQDTVLTEEFVYGGPA